MFRVQQLDHIALTVRDVRKSVRWYQDVLGLVRQHEEVWGSCPAVLGVAGTSLALFPVRVTIPSARSVTIPSVFDISRSELIGRTSSGREKT